MEALRIVLALVALGLAAEALYDGQGWCYNPDKDFYPYLSTRTAYYFIHGNLTRPRPHSCKPLQVWMLARHGTRYPGYSQLERYERLKRFRDEVVKNHERGVGELCEADLRNIRAWKPNPNVNAEMAQILTTEGKEDLRQLAKRLQSTYPELLSYDPRSYKQDDFIFRATNYERTQGNVESFSSGLFGSTSAAINNVVPPENDTLLEPHKNCPGWRRYNNQHGGSNERDAYTNGPEFQEMLLRVTKRLGLNETIEDSMVKIMYDVCRFETSWTPQRKMPSTWCTIFAPEDLKVLEYREDLNYYYCCGAGSSTAAKLGCEMITDMFDHFRKLENGNTWGQPRGIFYFAHTLATQALMAALRIGYEDKPLMGTSYNSAADRAYRSSYMGAFATNIVATFYRCENATSSSNQVTFHLAENLVHLPGCSADGFCDWEYLKWAFSENVGTCDPEFCGPAFKYDSDVSSSTSVPKLTASGAETTVAGLAVILAGVMLAVMRI